MCRTLIFVLHRVCNKDTCNLWKWCFARIGGRRSLLSNIFWSIIINWSPKPPCMVPPQHLVPVKKSHWMIWLLVRKTRVTTCSYMGYTTLECKGGREHISVSTLQLLARKPSLTLLCEARWAIIQFECKEHCGIDLTYA